MNSYIKNLKYESLSLLYSYENAIEFVLKDEYTLRP